MGFRFRRSIGVLPGIRVNLGKRGASVSVGRRGAHVTFGPTGTRTTVGLPGTGLSYTHLEKPADPDPAATGDVPPREQGSPLRGGRWLWLLLIAGLVLYRLLASR